MAKVAWSHEQAVEVLRLCREADARLNEIFQISETALPDDQKKRVRRAIAGMVGELFTEIEMPIHETYPDLLPSYLDLSRPMNAPDPD
ncbi:MAG: hypothetical protein HZY74_02365 [Brevundimonas sp.]|nr:MAG: hypothetical protein HZY74_02365 [Brevundimonas sp.]